MPVPVGWEGTVDIVKQMEAELATSPTAGSPQKGSTIIDALTPEAVAALQSMCTMIASHTETMGLDTMTANISAEFKPFYLLGAIAASGYSSLAKGTYEHKGAKAMKNIIDMGGMQAAIATYNSKRTSGPDDGAVIADFGSSHWIKFFVQVQQAMLNGCAGIGVNGMTQLTALTQQCVSRYAAVGSGVLFGSKLSTSAMLWKRVKRAKCPGVYVPGLDAAQMNDVFPGNAFAGGPVADLEQFLLQVQGDVNAKHFGPDKDQNWGQYRNDAQSKAPEEKARMMNDGRLMIARAFCNDGKFA